jgi:hypothetical protein
MRTVPAADETSELRANTFGMHGSLLVDAHFQSCMPGTEAGLGKNRSVANPGLKNRQPGSPVIRVIRVVRGSLPVRPPVR